MIAAAEQEYHAVRNDLDELLTGVHVRLTGLPEVEVATEVSKLLADSDAT